MYLDLHDGTCQNDRKQNIKDCIMVILSTAPNERVMLPAFGCNLKQYVFEMMNEATYARMRKDILYALSRWEYRIHDVKVTFHPKPEEGVLHCCLTYQVDDDTDQLIYQINANG